MCLIAIGTLYLYLYNDMAMLVTFSWASQHEGHTGAGWCFRFTPKHHMQRSCAG